MEKPRRFPRRLALPLTWAVIVLIAARLLVVQGFFKPVRLASGSMAPALLGPRFELPCGDCGFLLQIDAAQAEGDESAVCPNCGFAGNELAKATLQRGERVLIDRGAYWLRSPRRFEATAFSKPDAPKKLVVKRIVALPGETLELRGGDLYVNGHIVRKSLDQLCELAVPVYDDRFRARSEDLPPRWRSTDSGWTSSEGVYHYAGDFQPHSALSSSPQLSWLAYHHWRCSPLPGLRTQPSPVLDDFGFNLGPPRQLNPVSDLMLRCSVITTGDGCVAASLHDGRETFEVRLWPRRGKATVVRKGKIVSQATFSRMSDESGFQFEAAICDRQVLAAIDGVTIIVQPYEPAARPFRPSSRPIALGAAGLAVEASELVILRDVFYVPPPGWGRWSHDHPLADDEYLLLGDNAPISQDSRTWARSGVAQVAFCGPVSPWPFAQRGKNERRDRR